MLPLPSVVAVPPVSVWSHFGEWSVHDWAHRYLCSTVREAGIRLEIDDRLGSLSEHAIGIRIDGVECGFDIADVHATDLDLWSRYPAWFRFGYSPIFEPLTVIASFPMFSFADWDDYRRRTHPIRYDATGRAVVFNSASSPDEHVFGKHARRTRARGILAGHLGADLDDRWTGQAEFFDRIERCLCYVHVPGTHNHNLDRGPWQAMGLGVAVISPDIFSAPLERRPVGGVHYVACRDDCSDLIEKLEWVRAHPAEAVAIGRNAARFFAGHGTPDPIWRYARDRAIHPRSPGTQGLA